MDLKTLRLATLALTPELLRAFITYQQTLLAELETATHPEWAGRYAFAHGRAIAKAGLDSVELGKLKSMVGDFCGRRSAVLQVKERIAAASGEAEEAWLARAKAELLRLDDLSALRERIGEAALQLLQAEEGVLLRLHRALAAREGGAGHLHV